MRFKSSWELSLPWRESTCSQEHSACGLVCRITRIDVSGCGNSREPPHLPWGKGGKGKTSRAPISDEDQTPHYVRAGSNDSSDGAVSDNWRAATPTGTLGTCPIMRFPGVPSPKREWPLCGTEHCTSSSYLAEESVQIALRLPWAAKSQVGALSPR